MSNVPADTRQAEAYFSKGQALKAQGQFDLAIAHFQQALCCNLQFTPAIDNLAAMLAEQESRGQPPTALPPNRRALYGQAHYNLGVVRGEQGRMDEALGHYRLAVRYAPGDAEAQSNLGNVLRQQGHLDEAAACYYQALRIRPGSAEILNNLGAGLVELRRWTEAESVCRQALAINPHLPGVWNNLGEALKEQCRLDEALASYQQALRLHPRMPEAFNSMGDALKNQGRFDQALDCFAQALAIQPDFAGAHWNRALIWLLRGDFERGWPEYEWRWTQPTFVRRNFAQPLWDGSDLTGRTILIYCEQGHGDTVQFVRYLALVKQRGGQVIFECRPQMQQLFAGVAGIDHLVVEGSPLPRFDVQAPLLSLPRIFRTSLTTIPAAVPYLHVSPALVQKWRMERPPGSAFRIGIAWQGNPGNRGDRFRSFPLAKLAGIARLPGVELVSLQVGPGTEQLRSWPAQAPVLNLENRLGGAFDSFANIAAVMKHLDLVISCDSAVAHLAGALGVPIWVPLPHIADWRWLLERDDSPWYPTMRLFRQSRAGNWEAVFDKIANALISRISERTGGCPPQPQPQQQQQHQQQQMQPQPDAYARQQAAAHNNRGVAFAQQGRLDEAMPWFQQAFQLDPTNADACNNIASICEMQQRYDEAVAYYRQAVSLKPTHVQAHYNLGIVLHKQGKPDEAIASYERVLSMQSNHLDARNNLGNVLKDLGRLDEALVCYRHVLRLKPDFAEVHVNVGIVLGEQRDWEGAIACYKHALQLKPQYAEAYTNMGIALVKLGRFEEAMQCYNQALRIRPDFGGAHWNRALLLLMQGDFAQGWPAYEWRWTEHAKAMRHFPQAQWNGSDLHGRTILLHAEQGHGDTIQFIRYAPLVKQRGATVIVECQRSLMGLLASVAGIDKLVARNTPLPAFDIQAPLLSLPGIFRTDLATIPATIPYLGVEANVVRHWREVLSSVPEHIRVGIAWQGSPTNTNDRQRSIPLTHFKRLADVPGVQLISLQKGPGTAQLRGLAEPFPVLDLESRMGDDNTSFLSVAAIMKNIDLVISCDSAVGHLAGALGVPVWLVLPHIPDWRWLLLREDTRWYTTMRLMRQSKAYDWDGVFERMAGELTKTT